MSIFTTAKLLLFSDMSNFCANRTQKNNNFYAEVQQKVNYKLNSRPNLTQFLTQKLANLKNLINRHVIFDSHKRKKPFPSLLRPKYG